MSISIQSQNGSVRVEIQTHKAELLYIHIYKGKVILSSRVEFRSGPSILMDGPERLWNLKNKQKLEKLNRKHHPQPLRRRPFSRLPFVASCRHAYPPSPFAAPVEEAPFTAARRCPPSRFLFPAPLHRDQPVFSAKREANDLTFLLFGTFFLWFL